EEHQGFVEVVERVIDAGKTGAHAAFDDHDGARLIDIENRHPKDGARLVGARSRIGDVVGANDEGDIGLREVTVDFVHVEKAIVGNVGFREQDVHVPGHATGDRMNRKLHVHAALGERIVEFAHFVLRLRDGHTVTGNDDNFVGGGKNSSGFFGAGAAHR